MNLSRRGHITEASLAELLELGLAREAADVHAPLGHRRLPGWESHWTLSGMKLGCILVSSLIHSIGTFKRHSDTFEVPPQTWDCRQ